MTQIERRQARITRIRMRNDKNKKVDGYEQVAMNPDVHHCIGKSENFPEHIGLYVRERNGDPAVKVIPPQRCLIIR